MFITALIAATVVQSRVQPVPLIESALIGLVASLESGSDSHLASYFVVDRRYRRSQSRVPAKQIENARKNVENTSRALTKKQIDSAK